MSSAYVEYYLK